MLNLDKLISEIQNSKKTLFILCGFPYAGKTFVAEELRKHTDIVYINIDAIFHTHGFDWDTNKLPNADEWQEIFNESYGEVKTALDQGKSVLYDSTNHTRSSRDVLRGIALSVGAHSRVIFVNAPIEVIWRRWETNTQNPNRSVVSRELVQQTIDAFETPSSDEQVIEMHNDESVR